MKKILFSQKMLPYTPSLINKSLKLVIVKIKCISYFKEYSQQPFIYDFVLTNM